MKNKLLAISITLLLMKLLAPESLMAQGKVTHYISDTVLVGEQTKTTLEWRNNLIDIQTLITLNKDDSTLMVNNDLYKICTVVKLNDCYMINAIKQTGQFKGYSYEIEICDKIDSTNITNIMISNGKVSLLFVCKISNFIVSPVGCSTLLHTIINQKSTHYEKQ